MAFEHSHAALKFRHLEVEVARHEALIRLSPTVYPGFDTALFMGSALSPPSARPGDVEARRASVPVIALAVTVFRGSALLRGGMSPTVSAGIVALARAANTPAVTPTMSRSSGIWLSGPGRMGVSPTEPHGLSRSTLRCLPVTPGMKLAPDQAFEVGVPFAFPPPLMPGLSIRTSAHGGRIACVHSPRR